MGMEKAIASGKERRKPYRGAKAIDASCRNHGDDPWSKGNRVYASIKRKLEAEYSDEDFVEEGDGEEDEYEHLHDWAEYVVATKMEDGKDGNS